MRDIDFDIRMELLRAQPELTAAEATGMIADIGRCYSDIKADNAACGVTRRDDFYNFSMFKGVALVAIYRECVLEVLVFPADNTLICESEHLAMCDVEGFLRLVRGRFRVPEVGLQIPMSEALLWMGRTNTEDNEKA